MRFALKDPNVGYYGRELWLPKKHINVISAKAGLMFPVMGKDGVDYLQLWKDAGTHLIVPREFVPREEYHDLSFPIYSVCPQEYRHVEFRSKITLDFKNPDKTTQRDAFEAVLKIRSGILNLGCGKGKSVISLHHMAHRQVPALVIVNQASLIHQWAKYAKTFVDVEGGLGVVQGDPKDWDWRGRGIVVAMLHTLSQRYKELPEDFTRYFGTIYYDECHHMAAEHFNRACPMFFGDRIGLSATPEREDGLELVYQYHLGRIFYKDLIQELKPRIYIQQCPIKINVNDPAVKKLIVDKNGKVSLPKLRSYLGQLPENNRFIAEKLAIPLKKGRKVLALSHSVAQLRILHKMHPNSGICTGAEDAAQRLIDLHNSPITFGTLQLVKEALDEDTLDTEFFLTPFGSKDIQNGGKGTLQQGMGRTLRTRPGKRTPVVTILDYMYINKLHQQCNKLKQVLREWPADEGGPFEYETLRP